MDDDDNDEYDQEEDEDDTNIRSYSKKKHFGKLAKDVRLLHQKLYYRPKGQTFKPFKITAQSTKPNLREPFGPCKVKIEHKKQYTSFKSKTTFNFNTRTFLDAFNPEFNSKLTKKFGNSSFSFINQIKPNWNFSSKISHHFNIWERLKLKYGLEVESKNQNFLGGGNLNLQFKQVFKEIRLPLITQYTHFLSIGTAFKSNRRQNYNALYKSNFVTKDSHKAYFEHKTTYDPNSKATSPWSHNLSFNLQDAEAIGTINTSLQIEEGKIKSKEARFLIEYDKKYRLGVQKRNQDFQFILQRYKMKQRWLKSVKFYAGNKGFLGAFDGRLNFFRINVDYTLNLKVKPGGGNFYNDCTVGAYLKWNI